MPRTQPHSEMEQAEMATWIIQAEQSLALLEKQAKEAADARSRLHELLSAIKVAMGKEETAHESIKVSLEEVRKHLTAILDLQFRVKILEKEKTKEDIKTHAINWGPVIAAIASFIAAAAAYFFN